MKIGVSHGETEPQRREKRLFNIGSSLFLCGCGVSVAISFVMKPGHACS
jgi:hypothetical protein